MPVARLDAVLIANLSFFSICAACLVSSSLINHKAGQILHLNSPSLCLPAKPLLPSPVWKRDRTQRGFSRNYSPHITSSTHPESALLPPPHKWVVGSGWEGIFKDFWVQI